MKKPGHILKNHWMMFRYFLKFAPLYLICQILFTIYVSAVWTLSGPVALQYIFNGLTGGRSFQEILYFLIFVSVVILSRHIFGAICNEYLSSQAWVKVSAGMQKIIFKKAVGLDLAYYETPKFYTDFVWAASQADEKMREMCNVWMVFIARISEILFLGSFMMLTDPTLFLFAVAALTIRLIFSAKRIKTQYDIDMAVKPIERERDYTTRIFYLAEYAKEIRLSEIHISLFKKFRQAMGRIQKVYVEGGKKLCLYSLISGLSVDGLLDVLIYTYLSYQLLVTKVLSFGDISALSTSTWQFTNRMKQLVDVSAKFSQYSLYIDNFRSFLSCQAKIEDQPGRTAPSGAQPLVFKNVSFQYEGETKQSLRKINLTIQPHEKIAIVGYNGAGKSTLAKLLLRLYDVSEGTILLGDTDIRDFSTQTYRERFGSVFQDYKIFAGTIAENVVMDEFSGTNAERIEQSLKQSGFTAKLSTLEKGIQTPLTREFEQDGVNLSGGEEQKLAISRIFFKDCDYVILDEPSSALDPVSEYQLNQTMMELAKHKTVIFISHRLSTTCMADRILMLENGQIIEEGSHNELMELGGKYAEMFEKQAEKYRL